MENAETLEEAARRETLEEAETTVEQVQLYAVFSLANISQVYVLFKGTMQEPIQFGAGVESLEVRLFSEDEIPWENLAFPIVHKVLRYYFHDRQHHHFPVHYTDIM
jgi:ADP-ribose pyrophosphatase YjhB (NUDIX family)